MRCLGVLPAVLLLAACEKPQSINFGQKADGTPRARIWLDPEARRADAAARRAAAEAAGKPAASPGLPLPQAAVFEGPVTVGLRRDGACVVAGKEVHDEEVQTRLTYVREQRLSQGSQDVAVVTVLAEPQVPMDRVMRAMSCGHQAGFSKIGWQLVDAVPLPAAEPLAAAQPQDEGRLVISVQGDGAFRLGTESLSAAALGVKLGEAGATRKAQSLPPPAATILADKDAPVSAVKTALDACEAAGIQSVAFGSPVPVAAPGTVVMAGSPEADISEAYRNWKLALEGRDVDFSEGPPAYWYFQLFHAVLAEADFMMDALKDRTVNTERVRYYARKASEHLDQMAQLASAAEAGRGDGLAALSGDVLRLGDQIWGEQINLELARMRLKGIRDRTVSDHPPAKMAFPADLKIPPPAPKKEPKS